mmetsp:Transcript_20794/g.25446  ORF Transcript_20794/g.25446 Transcript_20794/m.25446 type:complete len:108 (+) Transcript_20794:426-749(+)
MKMSSKEQMVNRFQESKEVDKKIRRMLTADFSKESMLKMGDSHESFFTDKIPIADFKQQVDILSNLQPELSRKMNNNKAMGTSCSMTKDEIFSLAKKEKQNQPVVFS